MEESLKDFITSIAGSNSSKFLRVKKEKVEDDGAESSEPLPKRVPGQITTVGDGRMDEEADDWSTTSSSDDDDEEDDGVVYELPIYLCNRRDGKDAYALRYESRPTWSSHHAVSGFRVKCHQSLMQSDLSTNTLDTKHFDRNRSETLSALAGVSSGSTSGAAGPRTDQLTFESKSHGKHGSYYETRFVKGEVHLYPVVDVVSMRPKLPEWDGKPDGGGEDKVNEDNDEMLSAVSVKVSKSRSKVERERRLQQSNLQHEPWLELDYKEMEDKVDDEVDEMEDEVDKDEKMDEDKVVNEERSLLLRDQTPWQKMGEQSVDFVSQIFPPGFFSDDFASSTSVMVGGEGKMTNLVSLMCKAHALTFRTISQQLGGCKLGDSQLVSQLEYVASLVQGCWVVRSDVIYPRGDYRSPVSGVSGRILRDARDLVLTRFSQGLSVRRKDISSATKLSHDDVMLILEPIGERMKSETGWRFNLTTDNEFLQSHPSLCIQHQLIWNYRYQQISSQYKSLSKIETTSVEVTVGRVRRKSGSRRRRSGSGTMGEGGAESGVISLDHPAVLDLMEEVEKSVGKYLGKKYVVSVVEMKAELEVELGSKNLHPLSTTLLRSVLEKLDGWIQMDGDWQVDEEGGGGNVYALSTSGDDEVDMYVRPLLDIFITQPEVSGGVGEVVRRVQSRTSFSSTTDNIIYFVQRYCDVKRDVVRLRCC